MRLDLTREEAELVYQLVAAHHDRLLAPYVPTAQQQTVSPLLDKLRGQLERLEKGLLRPLREGLAAIPTGWR